MFSGCVDQISAWMSSNRLKMNSGKTQLICIGTWQQLRHLDLDRLRVCGNLVLLESSVRDLGVLLDKQLTFSQHVSSLCRLCFFQLRQLRQIISSLNEEATVTLVHAFIHSCLD